MFKAKDGDREIKKAGAMAGSLTYIFL